MVKQRYKVRLNSSDKVEELLQEIYDQACKHINEIQMEMNKLMNSTNLGGEDITMEDKAKYSKSMHDFFTDKNKALNAKFEIAKFMGELLKHNGDIDATLNDSSFKKATKLDLKGLKEALSTSDDAVPPKTYTLK